MTGERRDEEKQKRDEKGGGKETGKEGKGKEEVDEGN